MKDMFTSKTRRGRIGLAIGNRLAASFMLAAFACSVDAQTATKTISKESEVEIENEFLRIAVDSERHVGTIKSFFYKPAGRELSAHAFMGDRGGGPATLRTGLNYRLWQTEGAGELDAAIQTEPDGVRTLKTSFRWTAEQDGANYDFRIEQRYTLKPDESRLRVDWIVTNLADEPRTFSPWQQNILLHRGAFHTLLPQGHGDGSRPYQDNFFSPISSWMANAGEQTFFTVGEFSNIHESYMWQEHGGAPVTQYSLEQVYQPVRIDAQAEWTTTFFLGVAPQLSNVAFAAPEGAVAMEPLRLDAAKPAEITLTLAPVATLGDVRIEGRLTRKGETIMPLAPQYVAWKTGELRQIRYGVAPPEEGAYLIELFVYRNDQQYELGHEVDAYRKYIEIPLVVGALAADEVAMTPWPRGKSSVPAIVGREIDLPVVGADTAMRVGLAHPTQRVFREDRLTPEARAVDGIRRSLAKGEWESIPLVIFPSDEDGLSGAWVSVSDLKTESGKSLAGRIRIYRVGHILTKMPTDLREYPVGHYPDPLMPQDVPVDLSGRFNTTFWINVQAPLGAEAGDYAGAVRIRTLQGALEIPLAIHVWNFELPSPPALKTWAGAVGFDIPRQMKALGVDKYDQSAIWDAFRRRCLDYGFAPGHGMLFDLDQMKELQDYNRGFSVLPNVNDGIASSWASEENLKARGWADRAYVYAPFDEHGDDAVPKVAEWCRAWRDKHPHVKILDVYYGHNTEPLHGLVDVWCRQLQRNEWTKERLAAGDEFWLVNARLLWGVETDLFPGRQEYWKTWSHGYTGQLLWSVVSWGADPPDYRLIGANAIALNLFPIPGGITSTIRWEVMRDGLEDYDYLAVLRSRVQASEGGVRVDAGLLRRAREILDDEALHDKVTDWQSTEALREEIARLIESFPSDGVSAHNPQPK